MKSADCKQWEAANPDYVRGWDAALRAAHELTFMVICRETGVPAVTYNSAEGRALLAAYKLLREPSAMEESMIASAFPKQTEMERKTDE